MVLLGKWAPSHCECHRGTQCRDFPSVVLSMEPPHSNTPVADGGLGVVKTEEKRKSQLIRCLQ